MERNTAGNEEVALLEQSIEDMKAGKIVIVCVKRLENKTARNGTCIF